MMMPGVRNVRLAFFMEGLKNRDAQRTSPKNGLLRVSKSICSPAYTFF